VSDEPQRSLSGYKSPIHKQEDFANVNDGKQLLNDSDEYVLYLKGIPRVKKMPVDKEDKITKEKTKVLVDKAICEFVEESTKNIVVSFLKVESLNFDDDGKFESAVVTFFKKIKQPLPVDQDVDDWTKHFLPGMRFRSRVVVKKKVDASGNVVTNYYLDIPTCRPILQSDKHPDAIAASTETAPSDVLLATALKITVGCETAMDATNKLFERNAKTEVVQAFLAAHKAGSIKFPIQ